MSKLSVVPYETTLLVRDTCLCLHVQRAARVLARRFDRAMQPIGLSSGQFSLIMSLNRPVPPSIGSVAALLAMDRSTLTAALKPLQRRELVEIVPDPKNGRSRLLKLTPQGTALLARAIPIWDATHAAAESAFDLGDPNRFRNSLRSISE